MKLLSRSLRPHAIAPMTGLALLVLTLGALSLTSCDSSSSSPTEPPPTEAVFRVDSCPGQAGEIFRIRLTDPDRIAEANALLGQNRIVIGSLLAGDGGHNSPWTWHLDPSTIEFVEAAIEVCSGCASFVENDRDHWINVLGQYCPWSAVIIARER